LAAVLVVIIAASGLAVDGGSWSVCVQRFAFQCLFVRSLLIVCMCCWFRKNIIYNVVDDREYHLYVREEEEEEERTTTKDEAR
jgi:hypothetical protein